MTEACKQRASSAGWLASLIVRTKFLPLICALLAQPAFSQIPGPTAVNGNGQRGPITIDRPGADVITGTFYTGRPAESLLNGHFGTGTRWFVALRGNPADPSQAWIGRYNSALSSVDGEIYALKPAEGGGSPWRNIFAFEGNRPGPSAPSSPGSLPRRMGQDFYNRHPSNVAGVYRVTANQIAGDLRIYPQAADGRFKGTIYETDRVLGHYAWQTGTVVFVRYRGNDPIQVFRGTASDPARPELSGTFFPLNPTGGASPTTTAFAWNTTSVIPIWPRSNLIHQYPALPSGAIGVVANFQPSQATHSTPEVIETSCPLNRILTIFREPAVVSNRIQVAPGDVAAFSSPNHRQEFFWLCGVPGQPWRPSDFERTICASPGANVVTISRSGTGSRVRTRCYWSPNVP
jgi:hypothetical protein